MFTRAVTELAEGQKSSEKEQLRQRERWVPILTKGKLHIEPLPDDFPGETPAGAAIMVARVRAALNVRFQSSSAPRVLFTDRGNGFFNAGTGAITDGYRSALREHKLRSFFKDNAAVQPGELQEIMLHETAVAWMRQRLVKTRPKQAWTETLEDYRSRLKTCAAYINEHYNVDGLCRDLPTRLLELEEASGDRLRK